MTTVMRQLVYGHYTALLLLASTLVENITAYTHLLTAITTFRLQRWPYHRFTTITSTTRLLFNSAIYTISIPLNITIKKNKNLHAETKIFTNTASHFYHTVLC